MGEEELDRSQHESAMIIAKIGIECVMKFLPNG
jgi:hypothetical protein